MVTKSLAGTWSTGAEDGLVFEALSDAHVEPLLYPLTLNDGVVSHVPLFIGNALMIWLRDKLESDVCLYYEDSIRGPRNSHTIYPSHDNKTMYLPSVHMSGNRVNISGDGC